MSRKSEHCRRKAILSKHLSWRELRRVPGSGKRLKICQFGWLRGAASSLIASIQCRLGSLASCRTSLVQHTCAHALTCNTICSEMRRFAPECIATGSLIAQRYSHYQLSPEPIPRSCSSCWRSKAICTTPVWDPACSINAWNRLNIAVRTVAGNYRPACTNP
jgi:hypothetical protein